MDINQMVSAAVSTYGISQNRAYDLVGTGAAHRQQIIAAYEGWLAAQKSAPSRQESAAKLEALIGQIA
jgi:hypothetical protein